MRNTQPRQQRHQRSSLPGTRSQHIPPGLENTTLHVGVLKSQAECTGDSAVAAALQVPLDGVFEKGGVACVLAAGSGAWIGRQEQGEPRSDFFVSTRSAAQQLF